MIYELRSEGNVEVAASIAMPLLTGYVIARFVKEGKAMRRRNWMRKVREWAREHSG